MKRLFVFLSAAVLAVSCGNPFTLKMFEQKEISPCASGFSLRGEFRCTEGSLAVLEAAGYTVLFHNGPVDGTAKSGSLSSVRNIYRSLAEDGSWSSFEVYVLDDAINVRICGQDVVCYRQPESPYRSPGNEAMVFQEAPVRFVGVQGRTSFRNVEFGEAPASLDCCVANDETDDLAICFQQEDFPVIDWHVHLKGGLDASQARALSFKYGINYGIAPNAGEGGVGEMLLSDDDVYEYFDKVKDLPFLRGVQGEGRKWTRDFSAEALGIFDYLFTDAMTIVDHKGRLTRLYHPEEVIMDGISEDEYMDLIVDQTVKILENEPADIYANPTFLPACMADRYDELWTEERIGRVLDVLAAHGIALEINARYRIPSEKIVSMAKDRGIKFTFGTNNADADFGRLEYSLETAIECDLTPEDLWFPTMSTRSGRQAVLYNSFDDGEKTYLFNGTDLDGWVEVCDSTGVFSVKDGVISVVGKPFGYLRTAQKYTDYALHVEWRWVGKGTNSGIFQRVQDGDKVWTPAVECQLQAGHAGDLIGLVGARILELPYDPAVIFSKKTRNHPDAVVELPEGSWNRAEIICKGNKMTVYINGSLENEATLEFTEGYVAVQSEGGPLEFRNIYIKPVE